MPSASPRSEASTRMYAPLPLTTTISASATCAGPEVDELGRVDGHPARFADHLLTGTGQLVQVAALVPHRRVHRWDLVDLPGEVDELGSDLVGGRARSRRLPVTTTPSVSQVSLRSPSRTTQWYVFGWAWK